MKRIRIKLYKILRMIGLDRIQINLFTVFNEELNLDEFDEACYLYYLESNFSILIPDRDVSGLKTIGDTIDYLHKRTSDCGGLC